MNSAIYKRYGVPGEVQRLFLALRTCCAETEVEPPNAARAVRQKRWKPLSTQLLVRRRMTQELCRMKGEPGPGHAYKRLPTTLTSRKGYRETQRGPSCRCARRRPSIRRREHAARRMASSTQGWACASGQAAHV